MSIDAAIDAFKRIIKNSIGIEIESASTQAPPLPLSTTAETSITSAPELASGTHNESLITPTPESAEHTGEATPTVTPPEAVTNDSLSISEPEETELEETVGPSADTSIPASSESENISASTTIETQPQTSEQTPPQIPVQSEELEMLMDLIHNLEREFKTLRESLIERIEKIERRLDELEEQIRKGSVIVKGSVPSPPSSELHPEPIEHSFQTSDIDLLLHEAQEVLHSNEISLVRLIRLEAVEWQLLKIARKAGSQGKIPRQLLRDLRLEINRLRKHLLS